MVMLALIADKRLLMNDKDNNTCYLKLMECFCLDYRGCMFHSMFPMYLVSICFLSLLFLTGTSTVQSSDTRGNDILFKGQMSCTCRLVGFHCTEGNIMLVKYTEARAS